MGEDGREVNNPDLPPVKPNTVRLSVHGNRLWQKLLTIVLHDAAKAAALEQFEIDELYRKGLLPEGPLTVDTIEDAIERAIERWQRDNAPSL